MFVMKYTHASQCRRRFNLWNDCLNMNSVEYRIISKFDFELTTLFTVFYKQITDVYSLLTLFICPFARWVSVNLVYLWVALFSDTVLWLSDWWIDNFVPRNIWKCWLNWWPRVGYVLYCKMNCRDVSCPVKCLPTKPVCLYDLIC